MANLTTEWEPTLDSRRPVGDVPHISGCSAQHSLAGTRESPSVRAVWETELQDFLPDLSQGALETTQGPDPLSRIRPLTWCFSCRGGGI